MSTPEFLTTDTTTLADETRRAAVREQARLLAGAALATGGLWWVTTDLYGQWVFWTVFALGAVASAALSAVLALTAVLRHPATGEEPR